MKALTCEMCGSTNLIKEGGVFVCQSCGTKYSVEEAKKMMIEGTVSVKGTVSIDNSKSIDNYLVMARNAVTAGNYAEAEQYCNKIIEINHSHAEAWLLKGQAAGWQSTLANIRIDESVNCFENALNFAGDESESIKEKGLDAITDLLNALLRLACNHFAEYPGNDSYATVLQVQIQIVKAAEIIEKCGGDYEAFKQGQSEIMADGADNGYYKVSSEYHHEDYPSEYEWNSYTEGADAAVELYGLAIIDASDDEKVDYYKKMIEIEQETILSCSWTIGDEGNYVREYSFTDTAKETRANRVMEWHNKIQEIDPSYVIPERPKTSNSGCYVATAVYGSYNCPEVWTLRRFRDYTLDETWYGRAFIKLYYALSPGMVRMWGESETFKSLWRKPLDKLVNDLKAKGVEDTPYIDKY